MIKVYSNIIPWDGFLAMTVWPFMFIRKEYRSQFIAVDENHETIHAHQQKEMLCVSAVIMVIVILLTSISWWWICASPLVFFLWYVVEYLIRCIAYGNNSKAYRKISFEQEAFMYERDFDYLKNRRPFAWLCPPSKKA